MKVTREVVTVETLIHRVVFDALTSEDLAMLDRVLSYGATYPNKGYESFCEKILPIIRGPETRNP